MAGSADDAFLATAGTGQVVKVRSRGTERNGREGIFPNVGRSILFSVSGLLKSPKDNCGWWEPEA